MRNVFGEMLDAVWRRIGLERGPRTLPPRVEGDYETVVAPQAKSTESEAELGQKSDDIASEIKARFALDGTVLPPPKKKPLDIDGYLRKITKKGEKTSLRYAPFRRLRRHGE